MQHAIDLVLKLLIGLFDVIVAAIAVIEGGARRLLAELGIHGAPQTVILVVLLVLLIVAAFRVFGRLLALLLAIVLLLIVLHALFAGGMRPG